jgi:hypothetical protein
MNNDIQKVFAATHKPHSYLEDDVKSTGLNEFLEMTIDVTAGIETCLDLISSSEIARDCGDAPAIRPLDSANLLRFAMVASRLLRDEALLNVQRMNESAQRARSGS